MKTCLRSFIFVTLISSMALAQAAKPASQPKSKAAPAPAGTPRSLADTDLKAIQRPPLPPFHPQQPRRIELSNGMIVFLQEDHELPLIDGVAYIHGGSKSEPAGKVGLIDLYGEAWRTGGTKTKTGDQLDDALEARAAHVETGGGLDDTSISFSCLKQDFDAVFDDFNDVLRNPEFRQEKIDLARNNMRTAISRRNDDPGAIAARESQKIGYGPQSPYARIPEYATVNAITRQDMLDWHARYVHPNNIIFGIVGDFDSAAMEKKLRAAFEGWAKGPAYEDPKIPVNNPTPGIYLVAKDDINQSTIEMVAPGIRRDNPDYFAVSVMNEIFGGGFSSRLLQQLRTKAGLAYEVGGGVGAAFDHNGLSRIIMGTQSSSTAKAIEGLYQEIERMRDVPVTEAEVKRAKDTILNSFIFDYDSKEKVLRERMTYELYGYPADFLERFERGVKAVTNEDVDRVARQYLKKDEFAVLVVGNPGEFGQKLNTFGKVTPVDITIPPPKSAEKPSAPASSNEEGKALLARAIEAAGGPAKLAAIKALRTKQTVTLKAQGVSLERVETDVLPDKVHSIITLPGMGEMTSVVSPETNYMKMGENTQPVPAGQREDSLNSLHRSFYYVAQHAGDPKYSFAAVGKEKVGEVVASVLAISDGSTQFKWYIDPASGRVLRAQFEGNTPAGPGTISVDFSEWKTVDGITLPFHAEASSNGDVISTVATNSVEFNPQIDASLFAKPGDQK